MNKDKAVKPPLLAWLYPEGLEALQNGKCWTAYPTEHEDCNIPLYTAPPQRTWVGLTVDELIDLERKHLSHENLTRAIEAKLKEKNT